MSFVCVFLFLTFHVHQLYVAGEEVKANSSDHKPVQPEALDGLLTALLTNKEVNTTLNPTVQEGKAPNASTTTSKEPIPTNATSTAASESPTNLTAQETTANEKDKPRMTAETTQIQNRPSPDGAHPGMDPLFQPIGQATSLLAGPYGYIGILVPGPGRMGPRGPEGSGGPIPQGGGMGNGQMGHEGYQGTLDGQMLMGHVPMGPQGHVLMGPQGQIRMVPIRTMGMGRPLPTVPRRLMGSESPSPSEGMGINQIGLQEGMNGGAWGHPEVVGMNGLAGYPNERTNLAMGLAPKMNSIGYPEGTSSNLIMGPQQGSMMKGMGPPTQGMDIQDHRPPAGLSYSSPYANRP